MNEAVYSQKYSDMAAYVKSLLDKPGSEGHPRKNFVAYSRYQHTMRVCRWAQRLYEAYPQRDEVDLDALTIATIFHDVGYSEAWGERHPGAGARIAGDYLAKAGYDADRIAFICSLIGRHSNKELMREDDIPHELVILMEADLLDDTGAMELVFDAWLDVAVDSEKPDFYTILRHMQDCSLRHSYHDNILRSPLGREMWDKKQHFTREFIAEYERDLEMAVFE